MTDITPSRDHLLIKPDPRSKPKPKGLRIGSYFDDDQPHSCTGTVIKSGERCLIKANRCIIFAPYSGTEVQLDNEKLLIIREKDILGFLHA